MKRIALLSCAAFSLAACASPVGRGTSDTYRMTRVGMREAVTAPLSDFNLMRRKVPPVLQAASDDPYKLPASTDCETLIVEIRKLDLALGPDSDMPRGADKPTIGRRASHAASDAALDAVRDVTTGWIPFRSTVRRLTGASHHQDQFDDGVQAGIVRRAYLKGLGLQQGCAYPASPMPGAKTVVASKVKASVIASAESTPVPATVLPPHQEALPTPLQETAQPIPVYLPSNAPVAKIPPYDPPLPGG